MTGRILVVGSINTDLVTFLARLPDPGETIEAQQFLVLPGGKGANQAVAAARLGAEVAMVGRVGDDTFGPTALAGLATAGVSIDAVATSHGASSGIATLLVEPSGENRSIFVAGANALVGPDDVTDAMIAAASLVVLQLEIPVQTVYDVVARCRIADVPVLLNPAPAVALDFDRLQGLDYLVPNRGELAKLTGQDVGSTDAVVAAARRLVRRGVGTVVTTLGPDGALLVTAARVAHVAAPRVTAVDTTGAGDAFIGCFAQTLVATGDVDAALARAVGYAAVSVTRRGAQASYLNADEFAASNP